jgi:glycosyltransferase involved in cell wall biosynthesis
VKVLIINDLGTDTGGAERLSLDLRSELRTRGHEVRLFTSSAEPVPSVKVQADDTCRGASGHFRSALSVANPFALIALIRVLRRFKPDIVHLRMFQWQLSPLILSVLRDIPCLFHVVNYDMICPMNTKVLPDGEPCTHRAGVVCVKEGCMGLPGLVRYWAQSSLRDLYFDSACNRTITNSYWVQDQLEQNGIRVDDVVWNGVAVTKPRPLLGSNPPTVGYAGRLVPKKGVDTLVKAFSQVVRTVPNAKLLIAGEGESRDSLQRMAHDLDIGSHTEFLGHLSSSEMHKAFSGLWIQAAPSRWAEPFGLVAAEAMMRGTAVITSDQGGLAEQVAVGKTGYTAPPTDIQAWTQRLLRILTDGDHALDLGREARKHALKHFSISIFCDHILTQYKHLVANAAADSSVQNSDCE